MNGRGDEKPNQENKANLPVVEVVAAQKHNEGLTFEVDGVAVPFRELLLTSKVAGTIDSKHKDCKAGRFVKKNTVLMEIDPSDYRLEVERLKRELKQAEGGIKETDVEIANSKELLKLAGDALAVRQKELTRLERFYRDGVGTDAELDVAKRNELQSRNSELTIKSQARLLEARREKLEHSRDLVQSRLDKAELDLKRTKVLAPEDGVVVMDHVEVGTYVQPGTTLVTFEDTSAVEVRCNLRMEELNWLWRQEAGSDPSDDDKPKTGYEFPVTDATVIYELGGRRFTWKGKLSRYDGLGLDERSRTVPSRVFVKNPRAVGLEDTEALASSSPNVAGPPALVRGMFVTVRIHAQPKTKLLRLPEQAVRPGHAVWLVKDGKLLRTKIHVARVTPEGVFIDADRSGLSEGDLAVTTPMTATPKADGLGYVEEGQTVEVKSRK